MRLESTPAANMTDSPASLSELIVFVNSILKHKRHNYTLLHTLLTLTHYAIPREIYSRYSGDKVSRRKDEGQGVYRHSLTVEDCFRRETVCGPIAHLLSFPKKLTLVKFLFGWSQHC